MPKVSVIMGIYNCASTLQEALDSLYAQTFQDFEIILCDDGSKDNTYQIAYENQQKHPNIILLKNTHNMKLAATLNNCLNVAKGEYIARMDGDDISLVNRFEILVNFLDSHPEYAFVSSAMIHFDEDGEWKITQKESEPTKDSFKWSSPFCHAPVLMRKEALNAIGNYTTEPKVERMEDYYLWHKFYRAGYKGYNLQEPLYKMRDDKNATIRRRGFISNLRGYKTDMEILRNLKIPNFWIIPTILFCLNILIPNFMKHRLRKLKAKLLQQTCQK